ncbi:MAG: hypothetical protein HQK89_04010 [Nitrospirae bacterium]|nr:hypothetical protein [Nitrospirota bacterium]
MSTLEKEEVRKIVIEVLHDVISETQPQDNMILFLYTLVGDFREFKTQVNAKFVAIEGELYSIREELKQESDSIREELKQESDSIREELKKYLTKDDFDKRMDDYIVKIGVSVRDSVREIVREELRNKG